LFFAGSECAINADGEQVFEVSNVNQKQSLHFLSAYLKPATDRSDINGSNTSDLNVSRSSRHLTRKALAGIAMHKVDKAHEVLEQLANRTDDKLARQSIFWLADLKHPKASSVIDSVLKSEASDYVKKKAIFGLFELNTDDSWLRLVNIAKSQDYPTIRKEAIF
jgi:hypothetical protein